MRRAAAVCMFYRVAWASCARAAALLIDIGKVLRACAIGIKRRERLLDVRVDLPGAKDLIVFAVLDDKLMDIFVGIAKK